MVDTAGDLASAGVDVVCSGSDYVIDKSGKLVSGVVELVTDAGSFVADAGAGTIIDISGVPPGELNGYLAEAVRGNPGPLLQALEEQPRTTTQYSDRGIDESPSVKVGGVGFTLNVKPEIRDVEPLAA